jgi:hypothetical protein
VQFRGTGPTPLTLAAKAGIQEIVKILLSFDIDNDESEDDDTPGKRLRVNARDQVQSRHFVREASLRTRLM